MLMMCGFLLIQINKGLISHLRLLKNNSFYSENEMLNNNPSPFPFGFSKSTEIIQSRQGSLTCLLLFLSL